jgi:very-short-patch-repair endonuclease
MKSKFSQYYKASEKTEKQAISLRKRSTGAEKQFWNLVRNRRMFDLKFRRQHPLNKYIADFYCHELKLVIELDGEIHNLEHVKTRDAAREKAIKEFRVRVLRFKNEEVFKDPGFIEKTILELIL